MNHIFYNIKDSLYRTLKYHCVKNNNLVETLTGIMKLHCITLYIVFGLCLILIITGCSKSPDESPTEEKSPTEETADTITVLTVPYIDESDVTYIQPFGVPLDFGDGDIRPHAAVDFGCDDGAEFKASASGTLGNIWLNYPHSYQFNIVINDKYVVHYCVEPINIATLSDEDKLNAIYFSPGDSVKEGQKVCKMVGGGGHLDWGLIKDGERVCPACFLSDSEYVNVNVLFRNLPGSYEGYDSLCPDNSYHTNPR